MSTGTSARVSVQGSTIYVQQHQAKNPVKKKMLLPKTLPNLKKTSAQILGITGEIQAVYDETGSLITKIEDIMPDMTISISTKKPRGHDLASIQQNNGIIIDLADIPVFNPNDPNILKGKPLAPPKRKNSNQRLAIPLPSPMTSTTPSPKGELSDYAAQSIAPAISNVSIAAEMRRTSSRASHSGSTSASRSASRSQSRLTSQSRCSRITSRNGSGGTQKFISEGEMGKSTISRKRPQAIPITNIHSLIQRYYNEDIITSYLDWTIGTAENEVREFCDQGYIIETEQRQKWYFGIKNQPVFDRIRKIKPYESIQQHALDCIIKHRFMTKKEFTHRVQIAVVGPPKSGKTVLLSELIDQYTREIAYSGQWKQTFVYCLDMKEIMQRIDDLSEVYKYIVDTSLNTLAHQHLPSIGKVHQIHTLLLSLLEYRIPEFKSKIKSPLEQIAKNLSDSYRNPDCCEIFLTNMFLLPVFLAEDAGLDNFVYVIDNFEYGDIMYSPSAPFNFEQYIYFIEHIKYALNRVNFIIACEDQDVFFESLEPVDDNGINLYNGIDVITTTDIATVFDNETEIKGFYIYIDGEDIPIKLTIEMCGGVVPYIEKWNNLCGVMNQLVSAEPDSDEYDEYFFEALSQVQTLAGLLFERERPDDIIEIINITNICD